MAKSVEASTWENGFQEPATGEPWVHRAARDDSEDSYSTPPSVELLTSEAHNNVGINSLRTWPTMYNGTNSPHGVPEWFKPSSEVDVVICGAGPSGLEVALSLVRQGVSFRIIDKADGPLIAGRADGVQPRFLEILNTWGLSQEVHEEGPLIERTAIYKDGKKLLFARSHQCDSRYRGLHIITQGQIERIYIRDLLRRRILVERCSTLAEFEVEQNGSHPVRMTIRNEKTGRLEQVRSKFLVGSDGAASMVRKSLSIPFDGVSTDIYWGIMDCVFATDYPHAWVFGSVISTEHGGCVIIPREGNYIRLYTQLDVSATGPIAASRQASDASFAEAGGRVDVHSITPEEVLAQANRIFSPYKLSFDAPLSWFAVWKISERVARQFSSDDNRVHLVGDAAHVHSVMGAFGLNASIMDASNLAWKMGMASKGKAKLEEIMPTYDHERRAQACRIIETSGEYLRFVCSSDVPIKIFTEEELNRREPLLKPGDATLISPSKPMTNGHSGSTSHQNGSVNGTNGIKPHTNGHAAQDQQAKDLQFLGSFFSRNAKFLLGVDAPFSPSVLNPPNPTSSSPTTTTAPLPRCISVRNGVRAPNPRVCFSVSQTGYLYDKLLGAATFHILLFGSSLRGKVGRSLASFAARSLDAHDGFFARYGGADTFDVTLVLKCLPDELDALLLRGGESEEEVRGLRWLREYATTVFDDRAPDEDAHTTYGVDHSAGAVVVVRPDLWVGMSAVPDEKGSEGLEGYFGGFLNSV